MNKDQKTLILIIAIIAIFATAFGIYAYKHKEKGNYLGKSELILLKKYLLIHIFRKIFGYFPKIVYLCTRKELRINILHTKIS